MVRSRGKCIVAGFLGGLAPFLVNLARQFVGASTVQVEMTLLYFVGILIFASLGAGVVYLFEESNARKAFVLGISAPAMITLIAQNAEKKTALLELETDRIYAAESSVAWRLPFISSAFAQAPTVSVAIPDRTLEVQTKGRLPDIRVRLLDADGGTLKLVDVPLLDFQEISVPPSASAVVFEKGDSRTQKYPLPTQPDGRIYYEISGTAGRKELGFLSGITGNAPVLYDLRVEERPVQPVPSGTDAWTFLGKRSGGDWISRCLDLDSSLPQIGKIYVVVAPSTVLDRLGSGARRVGRLARGQKVKVLAWKADGPSPINTLVDDGLFYAHVVVQ